MTECLEMNIILHQPHREVGYHDNDKKDDEPYKHALRQFSAFG